jgi:hypothetical protein
MTVEMTPDYWQVAKAIAQDLSGTETDVNELKKIVAYLCWLRNREGDVSTEHLLNYLTILTEHGEVRSKKTVQYYSAIANACSTHLGSLSLGGDALIQILGWVGRLHHSPR